MKLAIVKVNLVSFSRLAAMLSETRTLLSVSVVVYLVLFDIVIKFEGKLLRPTLYLILCRVYFVLTVLC